jgi:Protein of unknown function (DUF1203)
MPSSYRFIAIPSSVADSVRATLTAPRYGHPAHVEIARGYGPCRHCLRTFRVGQEERILFTWDAFEGVEALPQPGPVFIHAATCPRHAEDAGFPEDLRAHPLTLVAFGRGRAHQGEVHVTDGAVEAALEALFARPGIDYVHVRDMQAGCYDLRVERRAA